MAREPRRSRAAGWNLLLLALLVLLAGAILILALAEHHGEPPAPHETAIPEALPVAPPPGS